MGADLRRYTTLDGSPAGVSRRGVPRSERRNLNRLSDGSSALAEALRAIPDLTVRPQEPLARSTTLKIGGPAELLVEAASEAALSRLATATHAAGVPLHLLGLGSNILIPDAGLTGVVTRLVGELKRVRVRPPRISAGGGAVLAQVARKAAAAGLAGLETLAGFPSTIGGAVFMNAGSYGTEIADVLASVRVVERDGRRRRLAPADLEAAYRSTNLKRTGAIVTRAHFSLRSGDAAALLGRIDELNRKRWASLPSGVPNAGSIFKNPPGDYAGRLIEACGLKGRTVGGAQISEKHANVIVNRGGASAADVLALMRAAHDAVAERFGVRLEPEIILLGGLATRWRGETA